MLFLLHQPPIILKTIRKAIKNAESVSDKVEQGLSIDGTYDTGYYASAGLANGIRAGASLVSGAASFVTGIASAVMRAGLQIGSPSKLTRQYGEWTTEGFALGMKDNLAQVQEAANMLASYSLGGFDMGNYNPGNTYNKTISAPINIALTVEGNVDGDDRQFTRSIAEDLVNLMNRESEVFA